MARDLIRRRRISENKRMSPSSSSSLMMIMMMMMMMMMMAGQKTSSEGLPWCIGSIAAGRRERLLPARRWCQVARHREGTFWLSRLKSARRPQPPEEPRVASGGLDGTEGTRTRVGSAGVTSGKKISSFVSTTVSTALYVCQMSQLEE